MSSRKPFSSVKRWLSTSEARKRAGRGAPLRWHDPLHDPKWLATQAWAVGSWIPFMFSAIVGIQRGVSPAMTAMGMAMAYALSSVLFNAIAKRGRSAGWLSAGVAVFGLVLGFASGLWGWAGLLLACAGLGAFRDVEIMGVMLRLAVRCNRSGRNADEAARMEFTLSVWLRTLCMAGLGWLSAIWPNMPLLMLGLVLVVLMPASLMKLPKIGAGECRRPADQNAVRARTTASGWMFSASMVWNILASPMLVAGAVAGLFGGGHQMGWFGTVCASTALLGLSLSHLLRMRPGEKTSAELCILGWMIAVLGVLEGGFGGLIGIVAGGAMAETFGRFWTRENNNYLRQAAGGGKRTFYRKHRRVVRRGFHRRGMASAASLAVAAAILPIGVGVLPLFMAGCAALAWKGVRSIDRDDLDD